MDEMLPRHRWRLGVVHGITHGSDSTVRSVSLRLVSGKIVNRAVNHVCPLEISAPPGGMDVSMDGSNDTEQWEKPVTENDETSKDATDDNNDEAAGQVEVAKDVNNRTNGRYNLRSMPRIDYSAMLHTKTAFQSDY
ncbi:hypothetical protein NEOKW01_2133 [Nematocida sp. AWRm80]|nr:hypothetical protein NEOKW01_2133 [Nematocida sp. AWRm80]